MSRKRIDLSGQKFGQWYVIKPIKVDGSHHTFYVCECRKCDGLYVVRSDNLKSGRTTMCACCGLGWKTHRRRVVDNE